MVQPTNNLAPATEAPQASSDSVGPSDGTAPPVTARTNARFAPALMWSYVLTTGGNLFGAFLQIGVTAVLGPHSFGVMVLAMVWVALGLMLLQHGPTMVVIQQDDITEDHVNTAFWVTIAGTTAFTGVFAALAPLWARLNHLPELAVICWALTPVLLLTGFNAILDSVIRRRMNMRSIALRNIGSSILSGLCGLAAAIAGWGVWALVIQQLTAVASYTVVLWFVTPWRPHWPKTRSMLRSLRQIRRGSLQTLAGGMGYFVSTKMDGVLMGMYFTPAAIGLYRFGTRLAEMVLDLTERGLEQISLPELARHNADRARLAERLGQFIHAAAIASFPALAVLGTAARPLVQVLGDQWEQGIAPLRVLCAVTAVGVINYMLSPGLQAAQRPGVPALFTWLTGAAFVGGFFGTIYITASFSEIGRLTSIAFAVLTLRTVLTGAMAYVAYFRILHASPWRTVSAIVPSVLASLVAIVAGWAVQRLIGPSVPALVTLFLTATVAGLCAGAVLLALDGVARDGLRRAVLKVRRRLVALRAATDAGV